MHAMGSHDKMATWKETRYLAVSSTIFIAKALVLAMGGAR